MTDTVDPYEGGARCDLRGVPGLDDRASSWSGSGSPRELMVDVEHSLRKRSNTRDCSHGVNTERVGRVTSGHVNLGGCARSDARDDSN